MIVESIVQGFGKITGDFRLGLLIAFDRFASIQPSISNIIEVLFAGALKAAPSNGSPSRVLTNGRG